MVAIFNDPALFHVLAKLLATNEAEEENSCNPEEETGPEVEFAPIKCLCMWLPAPHKQVVFVAVAAIGMQFGLGANAVPLHIMHCGDSS